MIERLLRALRHPLALALWIGAGLAVVSEFAVTIGRLAIFAGIGAGYLAGELLGRSRVRLVVGIGAVLSIATLGLLLGQALVWLPVPSLIGASTALALSVLIGWSSAAFGIVATIRTLVRRHPGWAGVELVALVGAFALALAAHRDGALARPHWLADAAWRHGFDPGTIVLAIGAMIGIGLALFRLGESRRRLTAISVLVAPLLALLVALFVDPSELQKPEDRPGDGLDEAMSGKDPGDEDKPAKPEEGSEKPRENEGKPDQGEKAAGQPSDGQPNDGQPNDGQPSEGQPSDGQPSDGQPSDGQPSDGQPNDGQPNDAGQGEPTAGNPQDGEPGTPAQAQPDLDGDSGGSASAPVAVVILEDDYDPPAGGYYLRQEAWSVYDGHRLVAATLPGMDADLLDHFPSARETVLAPPEADRTHVGGKVSVLVEHRRPFAIEGAVAFDVLPNPNPARFQRAWRFESLAQSVAYDQLFHRSAGASDWTDAQRAAYTAPPSDPRYDALAEELRGKLPEEWRDDPFAEALAVKTYLDEITKYSRRERHADADDPTAAYLFGNHVGYCVHTAHAAAYLWRSLGLPARVGTGYFVESSARRGDALLVMDRDAHAWPEIYLDGIGWVILDVAPKENLDPPAPPNDPDLTDLLADMAKDEPAAPPQPEPDLSALGAVLGRIAMAFAVALAGAVLAGHVFVKAWRRGRPLWAAPEDLPRVAYRTALDLCAEAGIVRGEGESRERFARRVRDACPSLEPLTTMHLAWHLGDPARRTPPDPAAWRSHLSSLRRELAVSRSRFRRWLGLFDPFSFWRVR